MYQGGQELILLSGGKSVVFNLGVEGILHSEYTENYTMLGCEARIEHTPQQKTWLRLLYHKKGKRGNERSNTHFPLLKLEYLSRLNITFNQHSN